MGPSHGDYRVPKGWPEEASPHGLGVGVPQSHMTYLLTQVPTLGTVPLEEGPSVFLTVWNSTSGTGAGVTGEVRHQAGFAWGAVSRRPGGPYSLPLLPLKLLN